MWKRKRKIGCDERRDDSMWLMWLFALEPFDSFAWLSLVLVSERSQYSKNFYTINLDSTTSNTILSSSLLPSQLRIFVSFFFCFPHLLRLADSIAGLLRKMQINRWNPGASQGCVSSRDLDGRNGFNTTSRNICGLWGRSLTSLGIVLYHLVRNHNIFSGLAGPSCAFSIAAT